MIEKGQREMERHRQAGRQEMARDGENKSYASHSKSYQCTVMVRTTRG